MDTQAAMFSAIARFWTEASPQQRRAFFAAWIGWILDAFDFTIFFLVMPQIGAELGVDREGLADVITATLVGRLFGGPIGGWLCDRFGRRRPMMASLVLYAVFDTMVAFATGRRELLVLRFLFGIGIGVEWSAGTALAMEHWPARTRGIASGLLNGSWAIGYFFAAIAFALVVPRFGWRALFYLAALPAIVAVFVRARVEESPLWTEDAAGATRRTWRDGLDLLRKRELLGAVVVGSLVLGGGFFCYYALAAFYPTLLAARRTSPGQVTKLITLFNAGMLAGALACGALSERIGRRAAIALFAGAAIPGALLYLLSRAAPWVSVGAVVGGFVGVGWTGATPSYLAEQFPTRLRGAGVGTCFHIGALVGAFAPQVVPRLERIGLSLEVSMVAAAAAGAGVVCSAVWLRAERQGASLGG